MNLYAYVGNLPVDRWNYLGLKKVCCVDSLKVIFLGITDSWSRGGYQHHFKTIIKYTPKGTMKDGNCCDPGLCRHRQQIRVFLKQDGKVSNTTIGSGTALEIDTYGDDGYGYIVDGKNETDLNEDPNIYEAGDFDKNEY